MIWYLQDSPQISLAIGKSLTDLLIQWSIFPQSLERSDLNALFVLDVRWITATAMQSSAFVSTLVLNKYMITILQNHPTKSKRNFSQ
jgi:hypothetical protein